MIRLTTAEIVKQLRLYARSCEELDSQDRGKGIEVAADFIKEFHPAFKHLRPTWRKMADGSWQALAVMAVVGTVKENADGFWWWDARVMGNCRLVDYGYEKSHYAPPIRGKATSLKGAFRIVETLLAETDTLHRKE